MSATNVLRQLALNQRDRNSFANAFYRAKTTEYRATLHELSVKYGHPRKRVVLSVDIRAALRREAEAHATQVVQTLNGYLVKEASRNAALTDSQLAEHLANYMVERGRVRGPLYARVETATARLDAQLSFYRENGVEPKFTFSGPTPKCDVCSSILAGNPYDTQTSFAIGYPHLQCVVAGTRVSPLGGAIGGQCARYVGPVVSVTTQLGERLTVTPQHPIATERGWIAAESLREGEYALRCVQRGGAVTSTIKPDAQGDDMPARAEDVFGALRLLGTSQAATATSDDFHGDGVSVQGEVEVVTVHRDLLAISHGQRVEMFGEREFVGADMRLRPFPSQGNATALLDRPRCAAHGGVGGAGVDPLDDLPPEFVEPSPEKLMADADFRAELGERFALDVTPVKVSEVRYVDSWAGQVFDFQTQSMTYAADTLLVHNCAHDWIAEPITAADLTEGGMRPGQISAGRGTVAGIVEGQPFLAKHGNSQEASAAAIRAL